MRGSVLVTLALAASGSSAAAALDSSRPMVARDAASSAVLLRGGLFRRRRRRNEADAPDKAVPATPSTGAVAVDVPAPAVAAALFSAVAESQRDPDAYPTSSSSGSEAESDDELSALRRAVTTLRSSAGPAFPLSLQTLATIVRNVVDNPDEARYRRLRLGNRIMHTRILSLEGGAACLGALGFRKQGDQGDAAAFVLDAVDAAALAKALDYIEGERKLAQAAADKAKGAAARLLQDAPAGVREALDGDGELRNAASAMVDHPLFTFLMADDVFRNSAEAAAREPSALRQLVRSFTLGRMRTLESREDYFDALLQNKGVVAMFTAEWCGPCRLLKPILAHLSQVPTLSRLEFVIVDGDKLPQVVQEAQVHAFPTVKLYIDCREQETVEGGDVHKLVQVLEAAAAGLAPQGPAAGGRDPRPGPRSGPEGQATGGA